MTTEQQDRTNPGQWEQVDEGWGRQAAVFATVSEPGNVREYVALHQLLGIGVGDRLLDVACGSGLALELAAIRGATCAGIDASPRLVAVARDRSPDADLRVGDMLALPWDDDSFGVVTSCRGIWGTTPGALREVARVLRPGGRLGLTVWGHLKASPGAWALAPFRLAAEAQVAHQAEMVALGRPGVGEQALTDAGLVDVRRVELPFAWEFPDPEGYARALASTGPAYEAIQSVGEQAFHDHCVEVARERVRDGLPLRAEIRLTAFVARRPAASAEETTDGPTFLAEAADTEGARRLYEEDRDDLGYVMNASRLWAHRPELVDDLFALMGRARDGASLSTRDRGILTTAMASSLGDSYCALAWGGKLAEAAGDPEVAVDALTGGEEHLDARERALAGWARTVTSRPNGTTPADVQALRAVGLTDDQVLAVTAFVALRLAFSVVNDALGARPDAALVASVPPAVVEAVTWGRPSEPA